MLIQWISGTELWVDGKWVSPPPGGLFNLIIENILPVRGIRYQLFVGDWRFSSGLTSGRFSSEY